MSGAESTSDETHGFDAGRGIQAEKKPDCLLEQNGVDRKDPEPVPPAPQNHVPSVQEIKALASTKLPKIPKVSKIILRVSGDMAEIVIAHDHKNASSAIIAIRPILVRFEDNFPGMYFEHMYVFTRYFDERLYRNFTDINA